MRYAARVTSYRTPICVDWIKSIASHILVGELFLVLQSSSFQKRSYFGIIRVHVYMPLRHAQVYASERAWMVLIITHQKHKEVVEFVDRIKPLMEL